MHNFEKLTIWKEAQDLAVDIYKMFIDNRDWGFKDQIQRAAVSISNNIAEGSEYDTNKVFIRYLNIAKGSCSEVRNMLHLSPKIGYLNTETANAYIEKSKELSNKIANFITTLKRANDILPNPKIQTSQVQQSKSPMAK